MKKCKWYPILLTGLVLLLAGSLVACGRQSPGAESSSSDQPPPTEQAARKPAEFQVDPLTVAPAEPMAGDSVTVMTAVTNTGDIGGTYTAILTVEGEEIDRKDISVEPHKSTAVHFQIAEVITGNYELTIGDSSTVMTVYEWASYTIQYDTGIVRADFGGIYVRGEYGHMTQFTPPTRPFKIQKVRFCCWANPKDKHEADTRKFTVRIWNKHGSELLWEQDFPWSSINLHMYSWTEIEVPDIRVHNDFNIEVVTYSEPLTIVQLGTFNTVAMAYDYPETSTERLAALHAERHGIETRSGYSYMGKWAKAPGRFEGITWFIRVEGEGKAPD